MFYYYYGSDVVVLCIFALILAASEFRENTEEVCLQYYTQW